jgi:hypothetical protein
VGKEHLGRRAAWGEVRRGRRGSAARSLRRASHRARDVAVRRRLAHLISLSTCLNKT